MPHDSSTLAVDTLIVDLSFSLYRTSSFKVYTPLVAAPDSVFPLIDLVALRADQDTTLYTCLMWPPRIGLSRAIRRCRCSPHPLLFLYECALQYTTARHIDHAKSRRKPLPTDCADWTQTWPCIGRCTGEGCEPYQRLVRGGDN